MSEIVKRSQVVNVGKNSFKDPANFSGVYLSAFSLYQTYSVDLDKAEDVSEKLYEHILESVDSKNLGDAKFRLNTYREDQLSLQNIGADYNNKSRTYIVLTRDTIRETRATILIRFLTYGKNLYVGVDTYVLGPLSMFAFVKKFLLTIVLPFFAIAPLSLFPGVGQLLLVAYLCLVIITWWGLIQRLRQTGDFKTALRLEFNKALDLGSFNLDDVFMFTKSSLYTIVTSVREVFSKEGLPVDSLDAFVKSINNISINTGGGSINVSEGSSIGVDNTSSSVPSTSAV